MLLRTHQSTNRFPGGIGLKGNIHVSDDTRLFTGTVPFVWSCDVYLQELIETVPAWYITVHITAQGSTTRIFKSETVEIQPDRICTVPFEPGSVQESDDTGQYSMVECQVSGIGGISNCMYVKIRAIETPPPPPPFTSITSVLGEICKKIPGQSRSTFSSRHMSHGFIFHDF